MSEELQKPADDVSTEKPAVEEKKIEVELPKELMASAIMTRIQSTKENQRYIIMVLATPEGKTLSWANLKLDEFLELVKSTFTNSQN